MKARPEARDTQTDCGGGWGGAGGISRVVRGNRYDFKASELSRLKNIISVILPDTFSYNLSFCACSPPGTEEKQSIFLSYCIRLKGESRV